MINIYQLKVHGSRFAQRYPVFFLAAFPSSMVLRFVEALFEFSRRPPFQVTLGEYIAKKKKIYLSFFPQNSDAKQQPTLPTCLIVPYTLQNDE